MAASAATTIRALRLRTARGYWPIRRAPDIDPEPMRQPTQGNAKRGPQPRHDQPRRRSIQRTVTEIVRRQADVDVRLSESDRAVLWPARQRKAPRSGGERGGPSAHWHFPRRGLAHRIDAGRSILRQLCNTSVSRRRPATECRLAAPTRGSRRGFIRAARGRPQGERKAPPLGQAGQSAAVAAKKAPLALGSGRGAVVFTSPGNEGNPSHISILRRLCNMSARR